MLSISDIKEYQNNRYPVLLIDRIVELEPGVSAKGIKLFSYNEWFFPGHYEDEPNVPGFVHIESLVQVFIMTFLSLPECKGKKTNFISIDKTRFWRRVIPGDVLVVDAKLDSFKRGLAKGSVVSSVEGERACSASFVVSVPDVMDKFKPQA